MLMLEKYRKDYDPKREATDPASFPLGVKKEEPS